jgi:uncharacterized protein (DUF1778 family)
MPESKMLRPTIQVRVTLAEREAYQEAADKEKRTLSDWARLILNQVVTRRKKQ